MCIVITGLQCGAEEAIMDVRVETAVAVWFIGTLVSAFIGSYLASYVKKKGENRAIREDLDKIVKSTKEIEEKISDDYWDRQKRWELRRDTVFEAARKVAKAIDAFGCATALYYGDVVQSFEPGTLQKERTKAVQDFREPRIVRQS